MKWINKIIDFIRLSPEESGIFQTVIGLENIRRVLYLTLLALPTSAMYFVIFMLEAGNATGVSYQWRRAISTSHAVMFASFLVISLLLYFYSFKPAKNNRAAKLCVNMTILILLLGGAVIAAADQLVTNNITPYLITCLITGLIILIPPFRALIYFIISFVVFYYAMSLTQSNHEILISNQINGITATALGLCLSFILWRGYLIRTKQSRLIEKQNQELKTALELVNSQKDDIEQLSRIGRDITSSLSIENIIRTIYENVNSLMDASIFTIGLSNPDTEFLEFPATIEKGRLLPAFSVPLSDESRLEAWCYNHQQDVIVNDCSTDCGKYLGRLTALTGDTPQSVLYLPLWHKDKVSGVISAQSFRKNAYRDYDVNVLRNLAAYCAIALDNAKTYRRLNELLDDLKTTQDKLVIQSKLAALGALTAGIAHEIKNPLNFVNNFAELSESLVKELEEEISAEPTDKEAMAEILVTLQQNAAKIKEHGKRADSIVRSMLQHSRGKSGERQLTDINAMLAEDINLAYHGMRAQDSTFNIKIETNLDASVGKLEVVPQDISRVFLNIISNACYETQRKKQAVGGSFAPLLSVSSRGVEDGLEVRIRDNGNGVPEAIRDKLFNPFFTTKPSGQGTGLGLSISYDIIVHEHHGELSFDSCEGEFAEFIIRLPR
ncbi:MAG: GAF domain-containing protein [Calditrichaeota bacterium]|nr:MAG: GAF domain-containing protein [Calditrichota bacterium]